MKNKGISLLVLIITIVVIIILATAIIVNLANTNIIGNANEAVLKQDIANLQSELEVYISDKYVDEKGKYDRIKLNADATTATYGTENIEDKNKDGTSNIYDIVGSLKKSKYKDVVYINEGNLVFKKSGLTDEEVRIVLEMGLEVDGMPKLTNITTEATYTSIKITLNVTLAEEVKEYIYILNDGENEQREESTELTKEYTGLTPGINYGLKVILVLKDGTEIPKEMVISTKNIDGELTYKLNEEEWTSEKWTSTDVKVTIEYSEEIMPEGYELQYRIRNVNGSEAEDETQEWNEYKETLVVTSNNTIVMGRLYNDKLDGGDAKLESSINISNIDKDAPTIPTTFTLTSAGGTITAVADGSVDTGSGFDKYMYSMDNTTWQDSNEFTGLENEVEYTIYAKAIDKVGNESEVVEEKITVKIEYNYYIVEVLGHYSGNSTIMNELDFFDKNNNEVEYVVFSDKVYDSVTGGTPEYWYNTIFDYTNLYDDEIAYSSNNSTVFMCKYAVNTTGNNTTSWARFLIGVEKNIEISNIKVCIGDTANRTPISVSTYKVDEYTDSTYTNNIKQKNNEGLTLFGKLEFDSALTEPTWFSFLEKIEKVEYNYYIVEVLGHYEGNGAVINELEFYDNLGNKIEYTVSKTEVYDSITGGLPEYWTYVDANYGSVWAYDNLYDGKTEYGGINGTFFMSATGVYCYGKNTTAFSRFLICVEDSINVSDIKISVGDSTSSLDGYRTPISVSAYEVNEYTDSTYTNNIKQKNDDGLTLFGILEFDSALLEPTWFSFAE